MSEKKRTGKEQILWRLHNVLRGQAMFIREDVFASPEERLEQMKVVEDLVFFLDNYDENIKILREHKQKEDKEKGER